MKKNAIGLYDPYLDTLGGGERHILSILQALAEQSRIAVIYRESWIVPVIVVEWILQVPAKLDAHPFLDAPILLRRDLRPQKASAGHHVAT